MKFTCWLLKLYCQDRWNGIIWIWGFETAWMKIRKCWQEYLVELMIRFFIWCIMIFQNCSNIGVLLFSDAVWIWIGCRLDVALLDWLNWFRLIRLCWLKLNKLIRFYLWMINLCFVKYGIYSPLLFRFLYIYGYINAKFIYFLLFCGICKHFANWRKFDIKMISF